MIQQTARLEKYGSNQWLEFLIHRINSYISNEFEYSENKLIFLKKYFRDNLIFYQNHKDFFENKNLTMLAIYSYCVTTNNYTYKNFEDIRVFLDCKELIDNHASRNRELRFNRDIKRILSVKFYVNYNKYI